jgi:hypothetical protein
MDRFDARLRFTATEHAIEWIDQSGIASPRRIYFANQPVEYPVERFHFDRC